MQLTNGPTSKQFPSVIAAMHNDRIERYLPAADKDTEDAFSLYLWNCALCEAFYLPLHIAEVACRNAIHTRLCERLGAQWYDNPTLRNMLADRHFDDLVATLDEERQQHGANFTEHHLVSSLTFGFWEHLLTKRFDRLLWPRGMKDVFPNLPNSMSREDVQRRVETVRRWRNRIAHHRAIFDKGPTAKFQDTLQLVRWISHDVSDWLTSASKVPVAISLRPL